MWLDSDLLPFAVRQDLARVPDDLRDRLLDPPSRSVIRDWAREHGATELGAALAPERFYLHATEVIASRLRHELQLPWTVEARMDTSDSTILVVQEGWSPVDATFDDVLRRTDDVLLALAEPLWRLGLEGSGRDAIEPMVPGGDGPTNPDSAAPRYPLRRVSGYVPRVEPW